MDRRSFLKGLLGGGVAAVAVHFGVSGPVAQEILQELTEDAQKTLVAMPGSGLLMPGQQIFLSTGRLVSYWCDKLRPQVQAMFPTEPDAGWISSRTAQEHTLRKAAQQLANAIDKDFRENKVPADSVLIEGLPKVRRGEYPGTFELVAGAKKEETIFGPEWRVGYIETDAPQIIIPD